MKYTLLLTLTVISFAACSQNIHVGVGPTIAIINNSDLQIHEQIGYYAGITLSERLGTYGGYGVGLQYMNQHNKFDDGAFNANSVNGLFYYAFYPFKEKFSIQAGFQLGYITSVKFDGEDVDNNEKGAASWLGGLSYDITEKISVNSKYYHSLGSQPFDNMVSVGVSYRVR